MYKADKAGFEVCTEVREWEKEGEWGKKARKKRKRVKKALTNGLRSGILTKLSARAGAGQEEKA